MQTEIEAKFLNVDHNELRTKLEKLGAKCVTPMRLMKRAIFDSEEGDFFKEGGRRLRVRDEGDKITATFKSDGLSKYDHEVEIIVNSFEDTVKLFESIGFKIISLQQSKREVWTLDDVEIMLDEWPWLAPYIEIEGTSEVGILQVAEKLAFNWDDAVFGSVDTAYQAQYPGMKNDDSISYVAKVIFDTPTPNYLKQRVHSEN
jgi:adenylate cyclase, class 2